MSSPARAGRVVRDSLSGPKAVRTREILVEAAGEQFLEHGYAETTVEHIADGAKVSRPTFYTYFRSKREIFEAVALVASDAVGVVFDDLGALPAQWTTEDIARLDRVVLRVPEAARPLGTRVATGCTRGSGGQRERPGQPSVPRAKDREASAWTGPPHGQRPDL